MIIKLELTPEEARTLQDFLFTTGHQDVCAGRVMKSKRVEERGQLAMQVAEHVQRQRRLLCST